MTRCSFLFGFRKVIAAAALLTASTLTFSQTGYPSKPIRLVVPTNPGGSIDTIARILSEELTKEFKQTVIVENKTGAGGMIAAASVAQASPDGHVILVTHTGVLQGDLLRKNASYKLSDLAAVAEVSNTPVAFGVSTSSPVTDLKSFIQLAKSKPGSLSYGSYGKGTSSHIWAEQFSQHAGIQMVHVPYAGEIPAMQDLLAGHVNSGWGAVGTYKQQAEANKIRILAIANPVRSILLPNVPTFIEEGFPEMNASGWCGIFVAAGTPKAVISQLSRAIVKTVQRRDVAARILVTGQEPTGTDDETFSKRIARDRATWAKAIADFNITVD